MDIRVGIVTAPKIDWERREPKDGERATFVIKNVCIGIGFHWERKEEQEFEGELEIRRNADGTETAINTINIEDYLTSVISSEMSADCQIELLKAHAVIARSWAIRAMGHHLHEGYDVCADDHCQRYEGIRRRNERAVEAVRSTAGQVLMYNGEVCDCRSHKCCGGRTEEYESCWEDIHVPYLESVDCPYCGRAQAHLEILRTILTDYDQETKDFHDWTAVYRNPGIKELIPLKRGPSGRIYQLKVIGYGLAENSERVSVIGKELAIRKALSDSCLYSSNFEVTKDGDAFVLTGHGWGHGVGLCQIGAAVMAAEGANYQEILNHYYRHSNLSHRSYK